MRPADLALLRTPGAPTLSPDGATAVVAVTRLDMQENEYRSVLWQVGTDGASPARQLTQGTKDSEPRFSPDGRWLAFLRAGEGKAQLHVLPTDGGEAVRVTDHPLGAGAAVWSPDSTAIAYTTRIPEPGRYGTDEKLTPDKEAPRLITELAYRVDGLGFTTDRRQHVFVVDVVRDGAPVDQPEPVQVTDGDWDDRGVAWSPDGTTLAFASARHERRHVDLAGDLFVCARDGSDLRQLTDSTTEPARPVFSPGGSEVFYTSPGDLGPDALDFVANHEGLWSVPVDGSAPATRHTAAEPDDLSDGLPMTSTPDGVLVGRLNRGAIELWSRPWGEGEPTLVIGGSRQVRGHDAAAGVVVATVADAGSAGELVALRDGVETVLTSFGAAMTEAGGLREVREFAATSADGYPVHGWIVRPEGDGPHPVLLNVHGGPYAQYGWTLFDEAQVYAGAGYAVVMCNPRGAAGYGAAHGRSIRHDMGNLDAADVLAFLDAALGEPDLDADRVGVMGGSYGGYMTTWLIGHTDRFAAAISERAFNEPVSFTGSSDIGWFFPGEYVGREPGLVAKQSPFSFLDNISTPTLVIHSEHDWRCPVEQGQRLFVALKQRGVETELLLFPGEGHELSRSGLPSHRVARFDHVLRWWGMHLPSSVNPAPAPEDPERAVGGEATAPDVAEDHAASVAAPQSAPKV